MNKILKYGYGCLARVLYLISILILCPFLIITFFIEPFVYIISGWSLVSYVAELQYKYCKWFSEKFKIKI